MEIVIVLSWILVAANYARFRDILYPAHLQALIWAVIVTAFAIFQDDFYPVRGETWACIGLGVVAFTIGCFFSTLDHRPVKTRNELAAVPRQSYFYPLLLLAMIALPLMMMKAQNFADEGPMSNTYGNVRYALNQNRQETGGYGILLYFMPLAFFTTGMQFLRHLGRSSKSSLALLAISILVSLSYGLLTTARTSIIALFCVLYFVPLILRRANATKAFLSFLVTVVVIFLVVGYVIGKIAQSASHSEAVYKSLSLTLKTYFLAPVPAFDQLVQHGSPYEGGENVLRSLYAIGQAIGYRVDAKSTYRDFTRTPLRTNVYTVYQPYFLDFGPLVLPVFLLFFGILHGMLYRKATLPYPRPIYVFLYSISMFPLFQQFFADAYFSLFSMWMQYTVYSVVFLAFLAESLPAYRESREEARERNGLWGEEAWSTER